MRRIHEVDAEAAKLLHAPEDVVYCERDVLDARARVVLHELRDLRVAEATRFDVTVQDGKIATYRVRLDISFKYEPGN